MMKKLFALLLSLCLLCSAASVLAEEDYSGTWYLVRGEKDGTTVNLSGLMSMVFDLKADGNVDITISIQDAEESSTGTWYAEDGTVYITEAGETMTGIVENGEIKIENSGVFMIFSRTAPDTQVVDLAPAVAAESAEPFNGTWVLDRYSAAGMTVSVGENNTGNVSGVIIQDGTIVETAFDDNGDPKTTEYQDVTFRDGSLVGMLTADDASASYEMVFTLREDGTLSAAGTFDEVEIIFVYKRTEPKNADSAGTSF